MGAALKDLPDEYTMTLEEAAAAIHASVKVRSLEDAARAKKLESVKIGATVLVTAAQVRDYLSDCTRKKCQDQPPRLGD